MVCFVLLVATSYDLILCLFSVTLQGHSVESSMPPLPENGPTVETTVLDLDPKGLDDSPMPSATSREEEATEATEEEPNPVAA